MTPLVRSDLFRFTRWLTPRILLGIMAALLILIYMLGWFQIENAKGLSTSQVADLRDQVRLSNVPSTSMSIVAGVGSILVVVLTAMTIGGEYASGTIRTMLPRAPGRVSYLTARLIAIGLFIPVLVIFGFLVALACSLVISGPLNLGTDTGPNFALRTLGALGLSIYVMLVPMALAGLAALWARSTGVGIGIGLGVTLVEQLVSSILRQSGLLKALLDAMPTTNTAAVLRAADHTLGASGSPSPWQGAAVLAAYMAVLLAAAFWLFLRRDIRVGSSG